MHKIRIIFATLNKILIGAAAGGVVCATRSRFLGVPYFLFVHVKRVVVGFGLGGGVVPSAGRWLSLSPAPRCALHVACRSLSASWFVPWSRLLLEWSASSGLWS